ncbi:MAG: TraR/DksA C4-type zinc finger protein [Paludibacteraceae bacterium]|nr:TraR/DksA C4-type zinc finger protein [Paludibacteraceae bacterium]
MAEKTRYNDEELEEFRQLILSKLDTAQKEYDHLKNMLSNESGNDVNDTSPTFKNFEEGASTLSKELLSQQMQRQLNFITHLKNALIRIENKTYGICRITGKLIPKERLRAVPHATTTVEGKMSQK